MKAIDPTGRIVVIVDDGIATGSSMLAAIRSVRARKPLKLIVAIGVAPAQSLGRIEAEADEVVCLYAPADFYRWPVLRRLLGGYRRHGRSSSVRAARAA